MAQILHYRGDVTDFDPQRILGPDLHGARYAITAAEYDPAADMTTATLRIIPPAELHNRLSELHNRLSGGVQ